jgi:DNA-directed RNA polymerase, beta subunit/140 kD subunit
MNLQDIVNATLLGTFQGNREEFALDCFKKYEVEEPALFLKKHVSVNQWWVLWYMAKNDVDRFKAAMAIMPRCKELAADPKAFHWLRRHCQQRLALRNRIKRQYQALKEGGSGIPLDDMVENALGERMTKKDNFETEIIFQADLVPKHRFKLTDMHGGKGVIVKVIPNDQLPKDRNGKVADITLHDYPSSPFRRPEGDSWISNLPRKK